MRAGQRRTCGGPDVEDDATGHTAQHGACQHTNSELALSTTAQFRSAEHYSFDHDALRGSNAENQSRDPARRPEGESCGAEQHCGQDEATAAHHDSDHDPVCPRACESYGAERDSGQGGDAAGGAEREYCQGHVTAADEHR